MEKNKVVLVCKEKLLALDATAVESVTEVERLFFLPGSRGLVKGIIALRGEPVAVVDLGEAFGVDLAPKGAKRRHKIVVVKDEGRTLGLDIGTAGLGFLWEEELRELSVSLRPGRFVSGTIEGGGRELQILNWAELYDETARILSGGKDAR